MSFQTRYFYAIIIGLPVVKPKYNIILCFELSSLWCKTTKSWMDHAEGNVTVPSQLWVQSFDFEGSEGKVISDLCNKSDSREK